MDLVKIKEFDLTQIHFHYSTSACLQKANAGAKARLESDREQFWDSLLMSLVNVSFTTL